MDANWKKKWQARFDDSQSQRQEESRNPFEIDRCRVIHSAGFRRLQAKTQIFGIRESSFHRTRLTHSIEVASVSSGVLSRLVHDNPDNEYLPNQDLIFTIGLLHDIGHPPFGHGGETALNYMMRNEKDGGFEGNGQSIRLVTKLENLRLSRRTLLGILKYPISYSDVGKTYVGPEKYEKNRIVPMNEFEPPKCYLDTEKPVINWIHDALSENDKQILKSKIEEAKSNPDLKLPRSLDCSIMDIADDIAYSVHDLEDAVTLKIIDRDRFFNYREHYFEKNPQSKFIIQKVEAQALAEFHEHHNEDLKEQTDIIDLLFHPSERIRKSAIGTLVYLCVKNAKIIEGSDFDEPLLRFNAILEEDTAIYIDYLKKFIRKHVVNSKQNMTIVYGGMLTIMRIFEALDSNKSILLDDKYQDSSRGVCDYIASMTDEDAYKMHERLFGFNTRSIFEVLPP